MHYYGYRYYQPQTGRFPSRDPAGEEASLLLYSFTENQPISSFDRLGLSTEEAHRGCEILKRFWKERTELRAGHHKDLWKKYLDGIKCEVKIECKKCCTDDDKTSSGKKACGRASGGGRRWFPPWGRNPCHIKICANWCGSYGTTLGMLDVMMHELTHCWQRCSGCGSHDCKSSICNEIQAYATRNPSLGVDPRSLLDAVRASSIPGYCKDDKEFDDTLAGIDPLDAWVIGCKEHGNCPEAP